MRKLFLLVSYSLCCLNIQAGAWTLEKNKLRLKSSFFLQQTAYRFASGITFCGEIPCEDGERATYLFNGKLQSYATFFNAAYGLSNRLELQIALPYYQISFTDDVDPKRAKTRSIGDLVFGARYNVMLKPLAYTVKIESKAPTGFFNKDAEIVPVGDGQWDLHIVNQFGRSLHPVKAYINIDIGYKIRFAPNASKSNLHPGNEFHFRSETGYNPTPGLWVKMAVAGFQGKEFRAAFGNSELLLTDSERKIVYLEPGLYWEFNSNWAVDLMVKYAISGKNYPAGFVYGAGISYTLQKDNKQEQIQS